MDLGLSGRVGVIAGASGGLGSAIATRLAAEGMALALVGRDLARLRDLSARVATRTLTIPADTTDQASVERMAERVAEEFGRCDVLVNAAAPPALSTPDTTLAQMRAEDIRQDFETKVLGAFRCIQALVPLIRSTGGGHIISISGLNARRTGSLSGSVRNVALAAMTKALADELGPDGIAVTAVHPGVVDSPAARTRMARRAEAAGRALDDLLGETVAQSSLRRLPTPEDIANIVAFLASDASAAISGDAIPAGGGERGVIHY